MDVAMGGNIGGKIRGSASGAGSALDDSAPHAPVGVYSEVGRLRAALVCRPGLAHERLTPRLCGELDFPAPLWVERAQHDFDAFVQALLQHGVEVLELHDLLTQTLQLPEARSWLLDHLLRGTGVGEAPGLELRAACDQIDAARLARLLIGGVTLADLGLPAGAAMGLGLALHPFVLPPLPNAVFARASHCWAQDGVALNLMARRGPRNETLLVAAVFRFHPRFQSARPRVWWGDVDGGMVYACAEGGDVMPLGHGVVLIGSGVRTHARSAVLIARALLESGAAQTVIIAQLPQTGGHETLEQVFTHCAPGVVTYRPDVVDRITCQELRPAALGAGVQAHPRSGEHLLDVLSGALGVKTLNAIPTGGDSVEGPSEPWDDGNGALALEPGVVLAFDRNARTNRRLRKAGVRVIEVPGGEWQRAGAVLHSLASPVARDAA